MTDRQKLADREAIKTALDYCHTLLGDFGNIYGSMESERGREIHKVVSVGRSKIDAAEAAMDRLTALRAPEAGEAEPVASIRPVAQVMEQLDDNEARVRWLFNPIPDGEQLLWDHHDAAPVSADAVPASADAVREEALALLMDAQCEYPSGARSADWHNRKRHLLKAMKPRQVQQPSNSPELLQWIERDGAKITLWMRNKSGTHLRYSVPLESSEGDVLVDLEAALSTAPVAGADAGLGVSRERAALVALYEWYDRDGSVGGASNVFEDNRAILALAATPQS